MPHLCPNCKTELPSSSSDPGKRVTCTHCGSVAMLPARPVPMNDTSTRTIIPALLMRFSCPECGSLLEMEAAYAGQSVQCGQCSHTFQAPDGVYGAGVHIGNCRLIRLLDEGGATGNLFLAQYLPENREVALKIFRLSSRISMSGAEQHLEIMTKASGIKHPNLVNVLGVGLESGQVYTMSEFVNAPPLSHLPAGSMLPEEQALNIVKQAARGLGHAADLYQMAHLQLRPSLLLLDKSGGVQVCGLGWPPGDVLSGVGRKSAVTNYASPEFLEGGFSMAARRQEGGRYIRTDQQSDIFSLGAILYQLLTGLVPFEAGSVAAGGASQGGAVLIDPRDLRAGISEGCVILLEKMLARPLDLRYRTWQEVLGDIDRVLARSLTGIPPMASGESLLRRQSASRTGRRPENFNPAAGTRTVSRMHNRAPVPPVAKSTPISGGVIAVYALLGGIFLAVVVATYVGVTRGKKPRETEARAAALAAAVPAGAESDVQPLKLAPATPAAAPKGAALAAPLAPATPRPVVAPVVPAPVPSHPVVAASAVAVAAVPVDARERVARLINEVAAHLVAGDAAAARRKLEAGRQDPELLNVFAEELSSVTKQLELPARLIPWLQASFRADAGRKLEVDFPAGRETLLIGELTGNEVAADKLVAGGKLGWKFNVQDVSLAEKVQRLRQERSPDRDFVCGWLYLEAAQPEKAGACFEAAGGLLGSALAQLLVKTPQSVDMAAAMADASAARLGDTRLAVPAKADLAVAEKGIRDLFRADFARPDPEDRLALARKLLQQARETTDDPASRYVLYHEAAAAGAEGGDAEQAIRAIQEKAAVFRVSALAEAEVLLSGMLGVVRTPESAQGLAQSCLTLAENAVRDEDFALAGTFLKQAAVAAKSAKDEVLATLAKNMQADVAVLRTQRKQIEEAELRLKLNPTDPEMNLAVGRFLCFTRGNWDKGLPLLAKGSDPVLKRLAAQELLPKQEPAELAALGAGWEAHANLATLPAERQMVLKRAVMAYERAIPRLSGISRTKVEKAVEEIDRQAVEKSKPLSLPLGRNVRLELTWINPGAFNMGSPAEEAGRGPDDQESLHRVRISNGFWIGRHEVTQAQWEQVMDTNPSALKNRKNPVDSVTVADCLEYCKRLSARFPGYRFRLPTEAEWEYACRAGTTGAYYSGRDEVVLGRSAWYRANASFGPQPAGLQQANAWGLFDMLGNVSEWCADSFDPKFYQTAPALDPECTHGGPLRVKRGGSYVSTAEAARCASRAGGPPEKGDPATGFRLCVQPSH